MRGTAIRVYIISLFLLAFAFAAIAQDPTPETPTPGGGQRPGGFGQTPQEPQPYEKIITKDAKSRKGLFTVHQVKDKFYYEIPKSEMGKDFLWVSQIQRTTNGVGYGGQALGSRVVQVGTWREQSCLPKTDQLQRGSGPEIAGGTGCP